jgi:hypothetical protein
MAKINVRSPYVVSDTTSNLLQSQLELYIYSGTKVSTITTPTYNIVGTAINSRVDFEISDLIRDYIDNNFDGTFPTDNVVWVNYRLTSITNTGSSTGSVVTRRAFYGYDYFNESANQSQRVMQSNSVIYTYADNGFHLPIDTEIVDNVVLIDNQGVETNISISTSNESDEQIRYISNVTNGADDFEQRVIQDGGTLEDSVCLQDIFEDFELFDINKIYVIGQDLDIINVVAVEECKYNPYKLTFVNKFGAYQDLWFFKNSNKSLTTEKDDYKSNGGAVNIHQYKILNKAGKEKLTINSGYYPESHNEVFKQLLLSEEVWIEIDNQTLPVNISNSSFNYKTQLKDKLINYTLDLDFAFDLINSVR